MTPPPAGSTQTLTPQHVADSQPAMEDLPDELLAEILRTVPPRSLAVCRSVCKHWCAAVDAHGLLLAVAHLVPCSLHGIFVNYAMARRSGFFSRVAPRTTSQSSIDGMLSFLPGQLMRYRSVLDHRNGLLLYENSQGMYVCNPATRRWATLSAPPSYNHLPFYRHRMYLMFDPTMSMHYDVLFFPDVPEKPKPPHLRPGESQISRADYEHERDSWGSTEWPPYIYPLQVFSSKTGRWEEKQFIRQGDAAVTVSDVWSDALAPTSSRNSLRRHAVYWRSSFYVHCDFGFIMRLSLEKQNYLVIKTPKLDTTVFVVDANATGRKRHLTTYGYLGKSKHGVYYTALCGYQLQVWVLRNTLESCQTPEWELKHQANLTSSLNLHYRKHLRREKYEKYWILNGWSEESEHGWDSSDDSAIDLEGGADRDYKKCYFTVDFLGYHPYKEIAFLGNHFQGFVYYLENSKLQYLGSPYPAYLGNGDYGLRPILESFIYTPCMDDLLPIQNDA